MFYAHDTKSKVVFSVKTQDWQINNGDQFAETYPPLKLNMAAENRPSQKQTIVFQPSIFRCELLVLLVSGRVSHGFGYVEYVPFLPLRRSLHGWSWQSYIWDGWVFSLLAFVDANTFMCGFWWCNPIKKTNIAKPFDSRLPNSFADVQNLCFLHWSRHFFENHRLCPCFQ